jgi:integrase
VYQRRDGRWVASVTQASGQRIYRYAGTRAQAAAQLTGDLKAVQENTPIPSERQTVGRYLTDWLESNAKPSLRPLTYISYESIVRGHLVPELGHVRLARLTPADVQAMMNRKLAAGLSARRVAYLRAVLRRALNDALRWGLIGRNAAALVRPPKGARYEVEPLDPDEVRRLLEAVRHDRLEALYVLAVTVGLRQGELLGLTWTDLDLGSGSLRVRHALQRFDHEYHLVEPKSARSRRTVALPSVARAALTRHRAGQRDEAAFAGELWQEQGLVFATATGQPLDASGVTAALQRHLARAGLRRQRFHDLRHACASLLLVRGVSPRVVMEILGHSQISLTMNTYSHVLPTLLTDAADQMDRLLGDA